MRIGFEKIQLERAHDIPRVGGTPYFVRDFLAQFDAVFTLNQDTLLEQQYKGANVRQASQGKWFGFDTPGVKQLTANGQPYASPGLYTPSDPPYAVNRDSSRISSCMVRPIGAPKRRELSVADHGWKQGIRHRYSAVADLVSRRI
jgi:hypothetical protein